MSIPCVVVICDNVVENVFQCEDGNHAERLFLSLVTKAFKKEPWPKSEQEALDDGFVDYPRGSVCLFWTTTPEDDEKEYEQDRCDSCKEVFCVDCRFREILEGSQVRYFCAWAQRTKPLKINYVTKQKVEHPIVPCHLCNKDGKCQHFKPNQTNLNDPTKAGKHPS